MPPPEEAGVSTGFRNGALHGQMNCILAYSIEYLSACRKRADGFWLKYQPYSFFQFSADSLDSFVDMEVYFAVLDDTMLAMGQEIYHAMFDYTGDSLLVSIDKEKLWQCIELLCKIRKIEWKTPPSKNGLNYFPFPIYPEGIWQVFNLMKPDRDYGKHMEQQPRNIVPSEMSVEQINTRLTLIQRSERFGDGNVAAEIENGNLLKMLLRLDDLLNKSVKN